MPYKQLRYLLDAEVQSSDDATKIVKLPLSNVLHTLWVKVACTTGSTNCQDQDIDNVVDKIEVIGNGSEVLFSMTPQEIRRWALLDYKNPIAEYVDERASKVMYAVYPILFGRYEDDPNYWLPCDRFTDLELRIKYSPTIANTAWATGTVTITVMALMTMGGPPGEYRGTLRKTTIYDWTTAASGDEVINLPRRLLWRRLMVYCYEAGVAEGVDINRVKLSLNNDELIPLNIKWLDLQEWNQKLWDVHNYRSMIIHRANDDVVHTKVSRIQAAAVKSIESADLTNKLLYYLHPDDFTGDAVTLESLVANLTSGSEDLTANTSDVAGMLYVVGIGIPHAVVIPFEGWFNEGYFDPTRYDLVQLVLTQGGAGGDAKVSLEEILRVG